MKRKYTKKQKKKKYIYIKENILPFDSESENSDALTSGLF